jgi:nucleoside-diphosphate-sugar epimerase
LVAAGWQIRALHRSADDAAKLRKLGAEPVLADLGDVGRLQEAIGDAETVFHCAALFRMWARAADFDRVNVEGTRNLLLAAQAAHVGRFVHIGAAGIVMGRGRPMTGVTEDAPFAYPSWAPYLASKARAEDLVLAADDPSGMRTTAILPPMIWGVGMPMLDETIGNVRAGRFAWPGGGRSRMSTAHALNVCHAAILAAERSPGGRAYFVSDGRDRTLREVMSTLLATRGVDAGDRSAPIRVAWIMAAAMERAWRILRLRGEPPLTRQMLRLVGWDFTISDNRARRELGYHPVIGWDEGVAQMQSA